MKTSEMESTNFLLEWRSSVRCLVQKHFLRWLIRKSVCIWNTSLPVKNSENEVKSGCSEKYLRWRVHFFIHKGGLQGVWCKNFLLADLLRSHHLFEILQTSLTFKNSENLVKSECFELLRWRAANGFEMKEWDKVSCAKYLYFVKLLGGRHLFET